ncbi:MAG: hypothetical protein LBF26_03480 [Puniceicoccales bacterium]|jgi:hypothetical protein|nr:hypothetical protein [Puniceicoccales bacterium]
MSASVKIENSNDVSDAVSSTQTALPKIRIKWETSSILWCAAICTTTVGLLTCITATALGVTAPTLIPFLTPFVNSFYRMAVGCLLAALSASFFFIFSIRWVRA